jgi:hypothetical protein
MIEKKKKSLKECTQTQIKGKKKKKQIPKH